MGKIVGLVVEQKAEKLTCPHCDKEYTTEDGLARHIKDKHPDAATEPGNGEGQE